MMRRFLAIGLVWIGCALAWVILGSTLVVRSGEASSGLSREVHELWGGPIEQHSPTGELTPVALQPVPIATPPAARDAMPARLEASRIAVRLELEHRKKGLIWFPTYQVDFAARYTFSNPDDSRRMLAVRFPLETTNALYDGFEVTEEGGEVVASRVSDGAATFSAELAAGQSRTYSVKYRSRGTGSFRYRLSTGTAQVKNFELVLDSDFADVDFPASSLSPTVHNAIASGWHGEWNFKTLLTSAPIGIDLPQKLNPGPLASRITFFAPVSLLFFFFVVAIFGASQKKSIHPMNYFFLGCAFFAFHLLFSYLVDHVAVVPAFAIASAISLVLVASYARLFVGWRFALREVGLSQLVYLVLFSFTFFFTGFTGLTVTIGAIVTLFLMMQITGRRRWGESDSAAEPQRACASPYRCPAEAETSPTG